MKLWTALECSSSVMALSSGQNERDSPRECGLGRLHPEMAGIDD